MLCSSYLCVLYTCTIDIVSSVGSLSCLTFDGDSASISPPPHWTSHMPFANDLIITPYTLCLTFLLPPGGGSTNWLVRDALEDTSEPIRLMAGIVKFLWQHEFFCEVNIARSNFIPGPTVTPVDLHMCAHVAVFA